jgi:HEPN domain-containing protein/predicted nucleotidyltransferase
VQTVERKPAQPGELTWRERIEAVVRACRRSGAQRAWVIGSAARETPDEGSDLDLVVEAETDHRAPDRAAQFAAGLDVLFPCDILVYRPQELQRLLEAGQPFLSRAMADARLIWDRGTETADRAWLERLDARRDERRRRRAEEEAAVAAWRAARAEECGPVFDPAAVARDWYQQAESDLGAARVLSAAGQHAQACFFAQQAGEKAVKAFLTRTGDRHVSGHDVGALVVHAKQRDARFAPLISDGAFLDRFYFATRYPDAWAGSAVPAAKYFQRDADEAIAAAERLIAAAGDALKERDGRDA